MKRIVLFIAAASAAFAQDNRRMLEFATYLGGRLGDAVAGIAMAKDGTIYVAGSTASPDFPVTPRAFQNASRGQASAFVARLSGDGTHLLASTLLGGTANAGATALTLDDAGNVYVAGTSAPLFGQPQDFPVTPGAHLTGSGDGFVAKLSANLDQLLASTLVERAPFAIAVDGEGFIHVAGTSNEVTTTPGAFQTRVRGERCTAPRRPPFPCADVWISKFNRDGSALLFTTLLGGEWEERFSALAVDESGSVFLAGETASSDFATTPGAPDRTFHGRLEVGPLTYGDGFLAKLSSDGRRLLYGTFLGGASADGVTAMMTRQGAVWLAGFTQSADFPATAGTFQGAYHGPFGGPPGSLGDGFVAHVNSSGSLVWSTYLGGSGLDQISRLAAAPGGAVYVGGLGQSNDLPLTEGSIPSCPARPSGQFVAKVAPDGSRAEAITRLPGFGIDAIHGMAALSDSRVVLAGVTRSIAFFATSSTVQPEYRGGDSDGFLVRLDLNARAGSYASCVVHAATLQPGGNPGFPNGAVSPGQLITLFGTGLAGSRVMFDNVPAPLLYASESQVNAVTPFAIRDRVRVELERAGVRVLLWTLPVVDATPGLFTADGSGRGALAALNQDGTVNSSSNPAAPGSVVSLFAAGLGALDPPLADGAIAPLALPLPVPRLRVRVVVSGRPAEVMYAGQAPGLVAGAVQVNVRLPEAEPVSNNRVSVTLFTDDFQSAPLSAVTLFVR